jgi:ribonuclease D
MDYRLIARKSELVRLAESLSGCRRIAFDLEADSMFHFREKVCLIQAAWDGGIAVIDPLALSDLSALAPVLSDRQRVKVFHGADYDVRSLYRDFGFRIRGLFDTELACRYLGHEETGLGSTLKRYYDVRVDKRYQKRNWSKRPLPDEMLAYAASDVRHLLPLSEQLEAELTAVNRLQWVQEECRILSRVRPTLTEQRPLFLRFKGAGRLGRRNLAVLESLLELRLRLAEQKDRPPFKIFSNDVVLRIVKLRPKNMNALQNSGILSPKQTRMFGTDILEAVATGLAVPDASLPVYPRKRAPKPDPSVPERIQRIRRWRDAKARSLQLDPALVLNKGLMTRIAKSEPKGFADLKKIEDLRNWQIQTFGEEILRSLSRKSKKLLP